MKLEEDKRDLNKISMQEKLIYMLKKINEWSNENDKNNELIKKLEKNNQKIKNRDKEKKS